MPKIMENGVLKNLSVDEYSNYVASLRANLPLNEDGTLKSQIVEDLDKIWVGGEEFSGMSYQGFLTVNTKTYVKEPGRANDGSIPNIDDHDTFIVPRCKVNFKFFSLEDYQRLCRVINSSNQFPVKYYDKQFGEFREYYMYVEPEEMAKLYNIGTSVFGLLDYEVSFIGTLNNLAEYTIKYITTGLTVRTIGDYSSTTKYSIDNVVKVINGEEINYYKYNNETSESGKPVSDIEYWTPIFKTIDEEQTVLWGNSTHILSYSDLTNFYIIPSGKTLKGWNTISDGSGLNILPNSNWTVFENVNIYPILV